MANGVTLIEKRWITLYNVYRQPHSSRYSVRRHSINPSKPSG